MTAFQPRNHSPYGRLLRTRVLDSQPASGEMEVEYEAGPEFTNRIGTIAGGMIASLLDSVTGLVANEGLPDGHFAVHSALSIRYHAPASPGRLVGRGEVVSRTERDVRANGRLFDAAGVHIASAEATLRVIRKRTSDD